MLGVWEITVIITSAVITIGLMSFLVKKGWNGILSVFLSIPMGFDDPFVCNVIM